MVTRSGISGGLDRLVGESGEYFIGYALSGAAGMDRRIVLLRQDRSEEAGVERRVGVRTCVPLGALLGNGWLAQRFAGMFTVMTHVRQSGFLNIMGGEG